MKRILTCCALGLMWSAPCVQAQTASLEGLAGGADGSPLSRAAAVSADGTVVVGRHRTAAGNDVAFRWTPDTGLVSLGDLPGGAVYSDAQGVSADGSVVVGLAAPEVGDEAFRWTAAEGMVGLGYLPGGSFFSDAAAASADGSVVVGGSRTGPNGEAGAFRWTAATGLASLGSLPGGSDFSGAAGVSADGSVVVGAAASANGFEAFRWTSDGGMVGLGDLPDGPFWSHAAAVSADGRVTVGEGTDADGALVAVRWTLAGAPEALGDLPGGRVFSLARAVSADGAVVVGQSDDGLPEAIRWTAATGLRTVASLLAEAGVDVSDWVLTGATGVSADGTVIVGFGFHRAAGRDEAWRAVLPLGTVAAAPGPAIAGLALDVTPNPAAASATLSFTLGASSAVRVAVVDALGREVLVATDGERAAGAQAVALDARRLPAGVYVARVSASGTVATRTFTVAR